MDKNQYTCENCNETYDYVNTTEWNDEKAKQEFLNKFPNCPNKYSAIVCDDCYQEIMKTIN